MASPSSPSVSRSGADLGGGHISRFAVSGLFCGAIWFALVGPEQTASWIIGLPTVVGSASIFTRLSGSGASRISVISALALIPLFAWESFRGGIDVAGRVLRPRLDLAPGLVDYRLGLTSNAARVFFINLVSLLPGTLTADLDGDRMRVHALNLGADPLPGVRRLEQRVAALFREALPAGAGTPL